MTYEAEFEYLSVVVRGDTIMTRRLSVSREPDCVSIFDLFR